MAKKVTKKKTTASKSGGVTAAGRKTTVKAKKTVKAAVKTTKKKAKVSPKNSGTVKKAPPKTQVRKASSSPAPAPVMVKTYLTHAELEHFKALLLDKLREITGDVAHIEKEFLQKSRQDATGDLSSMPIHMADIGSDNYEQEFTLGLMASERKIVEEILIALRRIKEGTYGMCEGTGEPIPKARLEAYPWARYCVRYAEMIEKGQVLEVRSTSSYSGSFAPSADEAEALAEAEDDDDAGDSAYEDDEEEDLIYDDDDDDDEEDDDSYYN